MGFIKNNGFVGEEHVSAFGTERQLREEERMVNDENSGILKFLSGLHVVTGFVEGASFAGTVAVFSTYCRPDFGIGLFFEFLKGAISDAVIICRLGKGFKLTGFFTIEKVSAFAGALEAE